MELPQALLNSLKEVEGFNRVAFEKVHTAQEPVTSIRINPAKASIINGEWAMAFNSQLINEQKVPWSEFGFYLKQRPSFTFDPLFHAGCYYVQEASSMFLEQALKQLADISKPIKVLDVSAAPGGKSTHIQSLLSADSLLVCNEVIKSRCNILVDNIIKWGCGNVVVTNNDPAAFKKLCGYFDVLVVDAPCSGSGLFRKDPQAIDEWSVNNVALCSSRQQRIVADVLPALKENGILIYSTCSYSKEENEDISDWLVEELEMENMKLQVDACWNIVESKSLKTNSFGYRFYPDKVNGEGFFISCFRKTSEEKESGLKSAKVEKASAKEKAIIQPWLQKKDAEIIKERDNFAAVSQIFFTEYALLRQVLNIQYKGTGLGQIMKDKLVPHHSLAMSNLISEDISTNELTWEEAIKYLQKAALNSKPYAPGWQLVSYKKYKLGWINALANRINNYYPKELRILKQSPQS